MPTKDQWPQLVEEWKKSGEIATTWCRKKKIHYPSFVSWRKKIIASTKEVPTSFVEVIEKEIETYPLKFKFQDFMFYVEKDFNENLLKRCLKVLKSL